MRPSPSRRGPGRRRRARQTARRARPNSPAGPREAHRSFLQVSRRLHREPELRARGSSRFRRASLRISVALQNGAKRSRDGDASLGVDLVRECRDKAVHPLFAASRTTSKANATSRKNSLRNSTRRTGGQWRSLRPRPSLEAGALPRTLPGADGHSWDRMGKPGRQWSINHLPWDEGSMKSKWLHRRRSCRGSHTCMQLIRSGMYRDSGAPRGACGRFATSPRQFPT